MAKVLAEIGLAFDDVLLVPQRSEVLPGEVVISIRIAGIDLNIPLMSAAMDTVTESRLAIALARQGGLGIIHKNLPIELQAKEVRETKKSESWVITDLFTLSPNAKLYLADQIMREHKISGIPIVVKGRAVGILTHRDIRFLDQKDFKRPVKDFMTKKLVTAQPGITPDRAKEILHQKKIEKLLIVDKGGKLVGLITSEDIEKREKYPKSCKDQLGRLRVGAAIGVSDDTIERCEALIEAGVDILVVDSSHGHSKGVLKTVELVKSKFPNTPVVGGNVATRQGAADLVNAGADCVKVGIGPGSTCSTRVINGSGVPQITAIMDCEQVTKVKGIPLIADGGIKYTGDVVKALAAGADAVMIGNLFAGTDEAPGDTVILQGRQYKTYRGMGSLSAMEKGKGSRERYFQDEKEIKKLVPEGIEGLVPHRGHLADNVYQIIGGLRSGMGINGAKNIKELQANALFIRITEAGKKESHPHSMIITKEAPNYSVDGGVR